MTENSDKSLVDRVKTNLLKGYKEESLRWALINQGYSRITVDRAIRKASEEIVAEDIAKEKEKQKETVERPKITYKVYDENNKIIYGKKSFWKRVFGKE
jgi:hypothetical protein